jgi:demethylmenaquinone methyltransferase/2-methoxy-6-polyprenyl-1,4-benzoquinol methylase
MNLEAKKIEGIYAGPVAKKYDMSMGHFFARLKEKAFKESTLKAGDHVLVFCCGTGLDFPHILRRIGEEGKITGVDFSGKMLKRAAEKISRNNWSNIELVHVDVITFENKLDPKADAGVCTLGMSIIPEFRSAYYNLLSNIRVGGEIIIGDMQLASGWQAHLNPLTISMAKRYGGTLEGHQNSLELSSLMKETLDNVRKEEYFFRAYFFSIGKKR